MSKMQNMSDEQIRKAIETFNQKLPLIPEGEDRDLCLVGLENFQNELKRRAQKKKRGSTSCKNRTVGTKNRCTGNTIGNATKGRNAKNKKVARGKQRS